VPRPGARTRSMTASGESASATCRGGGRKRPSGCSRATRTRSSRTIASPPSSATSGGPTAAGHRGPRRGRPRSDRALGDLQSAKRRRSQWPRRRLLADRRRGSGRGRRAPRRGRRPGRRPPNAGHRRRQPRRRQPKRKRQRRARCAKRACVLQRPPPRSRLVRPDSRPHRPGSRPHRRRPRVFRRRERPSRHPCSGGSAAGRLCCCRLPPARPRLGMATRPSPNPSSPRRFGERAPRCFAPLSSRLPLRPVPASDRPTDCGDLVAAPGRFGPGSHRNA